MLVSAVAAAVRAQFRSDFNYAKAGAVLSDLCPHGQEHAEIDLFSAADEKVPTKRNREKLMSAMDALDHRFGQDSARQRTAAVSSGLEIRIWSTRHERRPPRFTTRWDEVPVVRA